MIEIAKNVQILNMNVQNVKIINMLTTIISACVKINFMKKMKNVYDVVIFVINVMLFNAFSV